MKPRDIGGKTVKMVPAPSRSPSQPAVPEAEPRVVVNASLLDDVEINAELPAGVEVWTPGGVARPPSKPSIPATVDLWAPVGIKGPIKGPSAATNPPRQPLPKMRAQQATMLVPVAKRRNRQKSVVALSVAAFVAALVMLGGVLAWRHWRKTPAVVVRATLTAPDKSEGV